MTVGYFLNGIEFSHDKFPAFDGFAFDESMSDLKGSWPRIPSTKRVVVVNASFGHSVYFAKLKGTGPYADMVYKGWFGPAGVTATKAIARALSEPDQTRKPAW